MLWHVSELKYNIKALQIVLFICGAEGTPCTEVLFSKSIILGHDWKGSRAPADCWVLNSCSEYLASMSLANAYSCLKSHVHFYVAVFQHFTLSFYKLSWSCLGCKRFARLRFEVIVFIFQCIVIAGHLRWTGMTYSTPKTPGQPFEHF